MGNVTVPGCSVHINEILSAPWPRLGRQGSSLFMCFKLRSLGQLSISDQVSDQASDQA